ncbi:LytTR family DNA-binding domain-containing protein [Phenylobacterium sp.]|uniref:LytR/AlgR family response regulator transcription factor n=1 Tax=Phenylobacterium sp. TaxID=1871053 RepID=UPI00120C726E|nr:LytTR family DNA-binding domain-containing protein [Phenylobacterium sp.]THD56441.1 MAG: response regulator transcription factor [Phenylobacterium sp.]
MAAERPLRPGVAVTAVIAEDEPVLREQLQALLGALWPRLSVAAAVSNGVEALAMYDLHRPQVMFLDIQMPGLNGLQVAQQLADRCKVVFLTAYDAYAVAAFEQGAVDYVLKPYDTARLGAALRRVQERLGAAPPPIADLLRDLAAARPKPYLTWIKASRGADVDLIMVGDVCYFRADTKYTSVFTEGREALIRTSIKDLIADLDPARFWQIHRSTIVNVEAIASVSRTIAGGTVLKLKARPERLTVSEAHRKLFKHM